MARRPRARHALISGGSSGIGLALAHLLTARGAAVSLAARDPARLEAAARAIRAARQDARVQVFAADMTDAGAAARAVEAAEAAQGAPDLVIASAGAVRAGRFADLDPAAFRELMEVNYFGVLNLLRPTLARMREAGAGQALIIGSAAGLAGLPGYSAYAPTKFALRGLAEALRSEHKPLGVQISIAHPPDTDTPQLAAEREKRPPETTALAGNARIWPAGKVAEAILHGLDRGRAEIPVGLPTWALARLAPSVRPFLDRWFFDPAADRAREQDKPRR